MGNLKLTPTKQNDQIINALSWAIPLAVALLIGIQSKLNLGAWTKVLPHVIGLLNTSTAISLLYGFIAVKRKQLVQHQQAMSSLFARQRLFGAVYFIPHLQSFHPVWRSRLDSSAVLFSIDLSHSFVHRCGSFGFKIHLLCLEWTNCSA